MSHYAACFAACKLGHVGVFLLRHDAAACGEAVGNADEGKVLAHPDDEFFRQAADVDHDEAGGGGKFDGKVAVAYGIQAVLANAGCALRINHAQRAGDKLAV